jgi:hypothetical protein
MSSINPTLRDYVDIQGMPDLFPGVSCEGETRNKTVNLACSAGGHVLDVFTARHYFTITLKE